MAAEKMIRPPLLKQIRILRAIAIAFSIIAAPFLIVGIIALIDDPGSIYKWKPFRLIPRTSDSR